MIADPWAAVADPTRREILRRVLARPSGATEIAAALPVSRPAVSQHLQVLLEAGMVTVHPQGRQRIYRARPAGLEVLREELEAFWTQALASFKQVAEESYREQKEQG